MVNEADVRLFADKCKAIFEQVGRDIIGQEDIVELTVIAMISGGNVLLEGVPGIGKTRLIRSLGRVFSLPFSRIQFTPDLMPADITGTNVLEKDEKGNVKWTERGTFPYRDADAAAGYQKERRALGMTQVEDDFTVQHAPVPEKITPMQLEALEKFIVFGGEG